MKKYYEVGINRISIGLQSTDNNLLKMLGRIHKYNDFEDVYELANTDELSEDLKEKLKEGKKIEMLLRQEKFEPFTSEEILDRFEDFGE